jgi:GGDEF domain-containing protein
MRLLFLHQRRCHLTHCYVGRLGGEEFAILLPETDLSEAQIVADRLVKNLAGHGLMAHNVIST